jgi:hypothetical protein
MSTSHATANRASKTTMDRTMMENGFLGSRRADVVPGSVA